MSPYIKESERKMREHDHYQESWYERVERLAAENGTEAPVWALLQKASEPGLSWGEVMNLQAEIENLVGF